MRRLFRAYEDWRVRRLAAGPVIPTGAWLLDLGMPTPRAVRIKRAHDLQQEKL